MDGIGKTIEKIRKQKNISIKNLIEGSMTRSTYHRFKNGDIETSFSKVSHLLEQLNVRYEEFLFIHNHYQNDKMKESLYTIEKLFNQKNIDGFNEYIDRVEEEEWSNKLNKEHIISLCLLMENHLLKNETEIKNNNLIEYLEATESWTHYEVAMFNNCMKAMSTEGIDLFLNNIIRSIVAYKNSDESSHEVSRIIINALISFLSRKEVHLAHKWYRELCKQPLEERFFFERFFRKLLGAYMDYADGDFAREMDFQKFEDYLEFIECHDLACKISSMNKWMIKNYGGIT